MITEGEWKADLDTGEVRADDGMGGETPIYMLRDDIGDFMDEDERAANLRAGAAVPRMIALLREIAVRDDRPHYLPRIQELLAELGRA